MASRDLLLNGEQYLASLLRVVLPSSGFHTSRLSRLDERNGSGTLAVVGLSLTSYSLILYVLMTEKVSYVTAVRQCSVIFVVLLGGYTLKETYTKRRFIAAVVMVLGIFLIAIF